MSSPLHLTADEEPAFLQYEQIDFWQKRLEALTASKGSSEGKELQAESSAPPRRWELTRGLELHEWQHACADAWFAAGKRGVVKVVTGAGKTTLALTIIERLQQTTSGPSQGRRPGQHPPAGQKHYPTR
jgi:superfamily II DNA or RNA helicase